jgi:hypothetical protein
VLNAATDTTTVRIGKHRDERESEKVPTDGTPDGAPGSTKTPRP